jgi:hypothetical protein
MREAGDGDDVDGRRSCCERGSLLTKYFLHGWMTGKMQGEVGKVRSETRGGDGIG